MSDLISIIVPVYNSEKTLHRCITSVLKQSYRKLELILIDDGSTDGSLAICKMAEKRDSRVRVIHQVNRGVSSARNQGLKVAVGKNGMFVDSDDYIEEQMLLHYAKQMEVYHCDVVIGGVRIWESPEVYMDKLPDGHGVYGNEFWNIIGIDSEIAGYVCSKLFRMDIVHKHGLQFDEKMTSQEDLDFWLRYYNNCKNFYLSDDTGYQYVLARGKRIPPYDDFIRNQLKLLHFAEQKTTVSGKARSCIQQRISGYIYGILYAAGNNGTMLQACQELMQIDGLAEALQGSDIHGETGRLVSWLLNDKWDRMQHYWELRCLAKKVLRGNK